MANERGLRMSDRGRTNIEIGHRLAEAASAINVVADELRGMDRRGSYVDPTAAAERALSHIRPLPTRPPVHPEWLAVMEDLQEAIKELAHGLASLTRQVI